jgi:hypothetical protein
MKAFLKSVSFGIGLLIVLGIALYALFSECFVTIYPPNKLPFWLNIKWGASVDWILKNVDGTEKIDPPIPYDDGKINCNADISSLLINNVDANVSYLFCTDGLCGVLVQTKTRDSQALAMTDYFLIRDWLGERFNARTCENENKDNCVFEFISGRNSYSLHLLTNKSVSLVSLGIKPIR